jgi:hypothetical protein
MRLGSQHDSHRGLTCDSFPETASVSHVIPLTTTSTC